MASGQVLVKFQHIYVKAEGHVKRWSAEQERAVSLLGTVSNILGRLPALRSAANYGLLASIPAYSTKLYGKQLVALEGLLQQLQQALSEMALAVSALGKVAQDAERMVRQDKRLTPAARAAGAGPVPSVDQCVQGLQDIWRMHADEQRLQEALVREVGYGSSASEVQEVMRAAAARPNVDQQRARDAVYVVLTAAEAAR